MSIVAPIASCRPSTHRELIRTRELTFEILTDRGNEVAGKCGLRFPLSRPPISRLR